MVGKSSKSLLKILNFLEGYLAVDIMEGYYKIAKKTKVKVKEEK